jgi:hypothetical protein
MTWNWQQPDWPRFAGIFPALPQPNVDERGEIIEG